MTDRVDLIRIEQGEDGTFGVLRINGRAWCVTLEPPDNNNARSISRIPRGEYVCRRVRSPRFGTAFEVADVPGRSHILLHPGNVVRDTQGCVLLGRNFGQLQGGRAVLNSGSTFKAFMEEFDGVDEFRFIIEDVFGEAA